MQVTLKSIVNIAVNFFCTHLPSSLQQKYWYDLPTQKWNRNGLLIISVQHLMFVNLSLHLRSPFLSVMKEKLILSPCFSLIVWSWRENWIEDVSAKSIYTSSSLCHSAVDKILREGCFVFFLISVTVSYCFILELWICVIKVIVKFCDYSRLYFKAWIHPQCSLSLLHCKQNQSVNFNMQE